MKIHILVLRDCTPMVPVGMADMLRKTAELPAWVPGIEVRDDVEVTLVSAAKELTITAAGGIRITCDATLKEVRRSDLILVPSLDPEVLGHLELNRDVVPFLKRMSLAGADIATACTGAFALAEAGLLDGKSATTHWAFQDLFQARYPRVRLEAQAVIVDQSRVITSGGATSFLTLSLYLCERIFGAEAARAASRLFLIDVNKSPQSAYAIFGGQKAHDDEGIHKAQLLIEQQLAKAVSVDALAKSVAMSRRNFVRRFKRATGNVPREYVQRVRIEAAKRALETSSHPVADVSSAVGYEDADAFRKLFQRWTGLTPSEYRGRYGQRGAPTLVSRRRAAAAR
jgi:transcriptional regulator GlxA family with amidase domain